MMHDDDERLDAMLRRHLSAELDPLVGRSVQRFEAQHLPERTRLRLWWTAGAAAAAVVAIALLVRDRDSSRPPRIVEAPSTLRAAQPPDPPALTVLSRWVDEGTVSIDGTSPLRRVRRQVLEQAEWVDTENDARVRVFRPREQIILIGAQQQ